MSRVLIIKTGILNSYKDIYLISYIANILMKLVQEKEINDRIVIINNGSGGYINSRYLNLNL